MTTEEMVASLSAYHGKTVNGHAFTVTPDSLAKAAGKCGIQAVQKFFTDGLDSIVDGVKVSSVLAMADKKVVVGEVEIPKPFSTQKKT